MRALLNAALDRRKKLITPHTNAIRLIDGEGDALPNLYIDSYADRWVISTPSDRPPREVVSWLIDQGISAYSRRLDQHHKESPTHLCGPTVEAPFEILENSMRFEISFHSGYSQGIFLDQRDNRATLHSRMAPGLRLLNTFAYTGAFSVAAATAGAETTTLDLSQPYLDWARRNFQLNHIDPSTQHFCKGDTFHWLRRFAKQGRRFDAIVLDPPTFSRDENGKVFRVENDFGHLAALAADLLTPDGFLLCCTNCRKLTPDSFERQIVSSINRRMKPHHAPMPTDFTGDPYLKSLWLH
jgi:23S rRNA (cytosine1962-C5)-methyltransferase